MSEPTKELADEIFKQRVLRARRMTFDERLMECFRLFELECESIRQEIHAQHPTMAITQVEEFLRQRLQRQREIEEDGIYHVLSGEI